jgi:Lhr-like helicase
VKRGELDRIEIPEQPLDILAQQIVAAVASEERTEDDLFELVRRAWPYRNLERADYDEVLGILADGDRGAAAAATALRWAAPAQTNLDRNTVDMDRERASFADNAVRYEATLRFINGQLRTLQDAMRNHNGA